MAHDWPPQSDPATTACDRCGAFVSQRFYDYWNVDGTLNGCRECLPRSIRFGEDLYGRDPDDIEFDVDIHNRGKDPGGVRSTE